MSCPGYTPKGIEPCTRDPEHTGPCAHRLKHIAFELTVVVLCVFGMCWLFINIVRCLL